MTTFSFSSTPARSARLIVALALMLAVAALVGPTAVSAQVQQAPASPAGTIVVDGTCTLADAITAANTDTATGSCPAGSGADTIDLTVDVTLTSALPTITSQIILNGNGHTIARDAAAAQFRILYVYSSGNPGANLTLNQVTITGGFEPQLVINDFAGAGGIHVLDATLTVNDSTITGNGHATTSARGSGISALGSTMSINSSTISNNSDGCGVSGEDGSTVIRNSTVSGNYMCGVLSQTSDTTIESITISSNGVRPDESTSILHSAGLVSWSVNGQDTVTVRNTLIANQAGGNPSCSFIGTPASFTSGGHNLTSDASCGFTGTGDQQNVSAAALRLGPLADYGGPTQTHALLPGSVAIDAGDTSLTTDQRGIARPQGTADDIGAYEWQSGEGTCTYTNPTTASTEAELNAAILCFSQQTTAGTYHLNLGASIGLAASTTEISNPTSGVVLALDGGGYTVDGQNIAGVRPFAIAANTTASMDHLTVSGGHGFGGGFAGGILNGGTLTVSKSTISGNTAYDGGGIYNQLGILTVSNSTINANTASRNGGGVFATRNGSVTITDSTISGNTASKSGGGISLIGDITFSAGTLMVQRSTISGNTAISDSGGGIDLYLNTGQVTVANSTFSGNTAGSGGGMRNLNVFGPMVEIVNSTFSGNTAGSGGGGGLNLAGSTTVENTIIANSPSGGDCVGIAAAGSINNLIEDSGNACGLINGSNGNIVGTDPNLSALANNGGPTQTMALLTGSAAIDAGADAVCSAAPVSNLDQRSYVRPAGVHCDIGAYEANALPLAVTLASFDAAAHADHVLVTWETVSEMDNAGFNLYRTTTADPPAAADLLAYVPSQGPGSTQGFLYSYQDYDVTAGQAYWYWLEDVDLNGATTLHGPVSVVFVAPTAVTLSGLAAFSPTPLAAPWWLAAVAAALAAAAAVVWRRRTTI